MSRTWKIVLAATLTIGLAAVPLLAQNWGGGSGWCPWASAWWPGGQVRTADAAPTTPTPAASQRLGPGGPRGPNPDCPYYPNCTNCPRNANCPWAAGAASATPTSGSTPPAGVAARRGNAVCPYYPGGGPGRGRGAGRGAGRGMGRGVNPNCQYR